MLATMKTFPAESEPAKKLTGSAEAEGIKLLILLDSFWHWEISSRRLGFPIF
jgi:hypothetical protein